MLQWEHKVFSNAVLELYKTLSEMEVDPSSSGQCIRLMAKGQRMVGVPYDPHLSNRRRRAKRKMDFGSVMSC
jgi:hypothetical protein